jgi:hypothetical protein
MSMTRNFLNYAAQESVWLDYIARIFVYEQK